MKKLIETLKNIWKIEDLRQRLLITLLFVAIYRFGSFVVLPGINPAMLSQLQSQTAGGLMSLLDMFSGGAFSNASIFALGIMPYISASIVMQLLAVAVYPLADSGNPAVPGTGLPDEPEDDLWSCLGYGHLLVSLYGSCCHHPFRRKYVHSVVG